jgi:hypothetical protein
MTARTAALLFVTGVSTITVGAAGVLFAASMVGPLPLTVSQTTTQKQTTFDAIGESEVAVVPDNAQVSVGIDLNRATVADAQFEVNKVMEDIIARMTALGIDKKDIKTTNYSVNPDYDFSTGRQVARGYRVNSTLRIDVKKFDQVNQVIDGATAAGATQVHGVTFTLSDEKEAEVKKQAREEAIEKAQQNAQELAGLAGMRLGKVVNVWENAGGQQPPLMFDALKTADRAGGELNQATNVQAGTSTYHYSVTLSYETL